MVKKRMKVKKKTQTKRRIKTRDRPPRFQNNANQKTVVKVYNTFERMRKTLPRKKAQNYRYRDTSRVPSFQSIKQANGNISALGYFPASSNLINLSNMQKLIEDRVKSQTLLISDRPANKQEDKPTQPVQQRIERLPLGQVPADMVEFFRKQKNLGSVPNIKRFMDENGIAYNDKDTRAVLYSRIAIAKGQIKAEEWPGVLNIWAKTQQPKQQREPPEVSLLSDDLSLTEQKETAPPQPPQPPTPLRVLQREYEQVEQTPVKTEKKKRKTVLSRIKDAFTPNKRSLADEMKTVSLPREYVMNERTGDVKDLAGLSEKEINDLLENGYILVVDAPGSGTGIKPVYGSQIDLMMKDYRRRGYVGVYCIDELSTLLPKAIKGMDRWSCIVNTLKTTDPDTDTGHWFAIYCDRLNEKVLEAYDSLSNPISDELLKQLKPVVDSMDLPYMLKFKHNTIRNQRANSSTCGFLAVNYLMNRYDGISFKECTGFDNLEPQAQKLAKRFGYL